MEDYIVFGNRRIVVAIFNAHTDRFVQQIILNQEQVEKANKIFGIRESDPDYMCDVFDISLEQCDEIRVKIPKFYRNDNFVYEYGLNC